YGYPVSECPWRRAPHSHEPYRADDWYHGLRQGWTDGEPLVMWCLRRKGVGDHWRTLRLAVHDGEVDAEGFLDSPYQRLWHLCTAGYRRLPRRQVPSGCVRVVHGGDEHGRHGGGEPGTFPLDQLEEEGRVEPPH